MEKELSKQEELDKLDANIRRLLLKATGEDGDTSILPELNTAIQYLAKNNVVSEKAKSSVEDDIAKRLEEARERRDSSESK